MAIIKCKMCGGDIALSEDRTYGTCEYCGSTMTFPKVSDEQKLNLFNRANHFRRQNDFDKAIAAYDRILDEDDANAEAHWGAVLSRYGIEYVEDPSSHARIPTCHRVQAASILTDADYLAALEHAPDSRSRELYEQEAKRIAEIQRGILAISSQEQPYDVFICYKETDEGGSRTKDSALAQEIYYQLTNEGYKVFFSRITLEEKLGQQYEPYIFAALNSAKVMLVVGTKPEHFSAVWVKNEWSRYLALMRNDRSRLLIPCYRDMDPYDLPEELSALQSQDMARIGFMQDLIRGIKKVLNREAPKPQAAPAAPQENVQAAPLLKRAFMFLEDGDFARADEFCEKVLNLDPENARAYLGKLMARLKVRRTEDLKDCPTPFDGQNSYGKVMRFGDAALKAQLRGDIEHINRRNAYDRQKSIFDQAVQLLSHATTVEQCRQAAEEFKSVPDFEGVSAQLRACDARIEEINDAAYQKAVMLQFNGKWKEAIAAFEALGDYRDSRKQAQTSRDSRDAEEREKRERQEAERRRTEAKEKAKAAKQRKIIIITCVVVALAVGATLLYTEVIKPNSLYKKAMTAMESGHYDEATQLFEGLGEFKDAAIQAQESQYQKGVALLASGEYDEATTVFAALGDDGYSDAATQAQESQYQKGVALLAFGEYDEATAVFEALGDYGDAATQAQESQYQKGAVLFASGKYADAAAVFEALGEYSDAEAQAQESLYQKAAVLLVAGYDEEAAEAFSALGNYKDAAAQTQEIQYRDAEAFYKDGDYRSAYRLYAALGDYQDAAQRAAELRQKIVEEVASNSYRLSAGASHTVGIKTDATLVATGYNKDGRCDVNDWIDIVAVDEGYYHTVGLRTDGTAIATGYNGGGQCNVDDWTDIVALSAEYEHTVGLKRDGTVVAAGSNYHGESDVGDWTDIVAVAAGSFHTVGLKKNGTLVATGINTSGQCDVGGWTDIVTVVAGGSHTVGLKADGTVVATGSALNGSCEVEDWKDIVAVAAGDTHTVGLKADGTVVATGSDEHGECDVGDWTNIVAVAAGQDYSVGLKSNGMLVATGENDHGECDVSDWNLFD